MGLRTIQEPASANGLSHPLLVHYSTSERKAILVHRYFLGIELGREPAVEDTVRSWESRHARAWRQMKVQRDVAAQLLEIERHKYFISQKAGFDVGWETAAGDWIRSHAGHWREWWENQSAACP
ncbi:MAG: hypothetical protein ACRD2T_07935 [Thermoanaerobaculia bacterium]